MTGNRRRKPLAAAWAWPLHGPVSCAGQAVVWVRLLCGFGCCAASAVGRASCMTGGAGMDPRLQKNGAVFHLPAGGRKKFCRRLALSRFSAAKNSVEKGRHLITSQTSAAILSNNIQCVNLFSCQFALFYAKNSQNSYLQASSFFSSAALMVLAFPRRRIQMNVVKKKYNTSNYDVYFFSTAMKLSCAILWRVTF
jgi:hypothetical protein